LREKEPKRTLLFLKEKKQKNFNSLRWFLLGIPAETASLLFYWNIPERSPFL
jgi:hypothetical protein